jgi:hypothetical protein
MSSFPARVAILVGLCLRLVAAEEQVAKTHEYRCLPTTEDMVPPLALTALRRGTHGASLSAFKRSEHDGIVRYSAEFETMDNHHKEIAAYADGTLLGICDAPDAPATTAP